LRSAALGGPRTGRKIFVFAGMRELGVQGEREHSQVGTQAGQCGFSHVFLVGHGELQSTAESYRAARPDGTVVSVAGPEELKDRLLPLLRSGDTVLFKGPRKAGLAGAGKSIDVHLKADTDMHRLGVDPRTAVALARKIRDTGTMRLTGVCTHFAAADDPADDAFTRRQIAVFEETLAALRAEGF